MDLAMISDWLRRDKGRLVYVCGWTRQLLSTGPFGCTFLRVGGLVQLCLASATHLRYTALAGNVCFILAC